jgi:hypothetical protein
VLTRSDAAHELNSLESPIKYRNQKTRKKSANTQIFLSLAAAGKCAAATTAVHVLYYNSIRIVLKYEIMSSRMVAQPLAGRFAPTSILGDNDLAYGSG